jgi:hypothetical protein
MQMKKQSKQTNEMKHPISSRSYILRLWRTGELGVAEWHASLEDTFTRERFGFPVWSSYLHS